MSSSDRGAEDMSSGWISVEALQETVRVFTIGIFMGVADGVPGVSGGTIALIAGIYERLVVAITSLTPRLLTELGRSISPFGSGTSIAQAWVTLKDADIRFLIVLLGGILTAVITVGQIVIVAEQQAPVLLYGSFFGLIGSSALLLWREIEVRSIRGWMAALAGFGLAFVLSGNIQLLDSSGLGVVFVAGSIGVSAMILPGVSGSLMLVILGQYSRMYAVLDEFLEGVVVFVTDGTVRQVVGPAQVVVVFVLGGILGLVTISRLVRVMLELHRNLTMIFLVSLVFGALRAPITELTQIHGFRWTIETASTFSGAAGIASVIVVLLARQAGDISIEPQ